MRIYEDDEKEDVRLDKELMEFYQGDIQLILDLKKIFMTNAVPRKEKVLVKDNK